MTHAISPISLKLSQMIKVIKLFKSPKCFGLPVNPWGIMVLRDSGVRLIGVRHKVVSVGHIFLTCLLMTWRSI